MSGPTSITEKRLITRRDLLRGAGSLAALGLIGGGAWIFGRPSRRIEGQMMGAAAKSGHKLREGDFPPPSETLNASVVIVGGGIAGLAAAKRLHEKGIEDVLLLELESETGGNSRGGENQVSRYPWGAHYLPLPGPNDREVIALLEEFGVITGYDSAGLPIYNEYYLCADPHERLLMHGRWQEGLYPQTGTTEDDRAQYRRFHEMTEAFKKAIGRDGKRAFEIPVDDSSTDEEFTKLDRISMSQFMQEQGFTSKPLLWYVNYGCRDDYGARMEQTSAWAGLHYFASRNGVAANADSSTVLTWPEGNAWLATKLRGKVEHKIRTRALVHRLENQESKVTVDFFDLAAQKTVRVVAERVICATPQFIASRILYDRGGPVRDRAHAKDFSYAPWMIANVTVNGIPGGHGTPLSWDNVSYHSESLGYINATHQSLKREPKKTVLTYYLPLTELEPVEERKRAQGKTHEEWSRRVAKDLLTMNPDLKDHIERIDVWLWGHGMIRPTPNFIWGKSRKAARKPFGHVHFAHSDLSGISIFEEAFHHGLRAAGEVLKTVRVKGLST